MRGVFLDSGTLGQDLDFTPLTSTLSDWKLYDKTGPDEVLDRVQNAQIVVTNKVKLNELIFSKSQIKCIAIAATGADHIDLQTARAHGIVVCNVQGYSTDSVIQHTIGLLIALASKISAYSDLVKQGAWINAPFFCLQNFPMLELAGKKLGIIGYGAIGQGVARVAQALGMEIITRMPLADLLPQVDVLSLHCPLVKETYHLIDQHAIAQMKPGSLLINASRGGLIDEKALAEALKSGHLGGAALDVVEGEPPKPDTPLMAEAIPNLIITPHVAWSTTAARIRLLNEIALNIRAFTKGESRNKVA